MSKILKTLNKSDPEIEKKWLKVANTRLKDLHSGKVKGIPGDEVFKKIRNRFSE